MRPRELRRVVVTGLGVVSPLGVGKSRFWSRLVKGDCAVRSLVNDPSPGIGAFQGLPATVAATVPRGTQPGELNAADIVQQVRMHPKGKCGTNRLVRRDLLRYAEKPGSQSFSH
jgi:3-oxoacyl-(acyl-carrier-protein) synthase